MTDDQHQQRAVVKQEVLSPVPRDGPFQRRCRSSPSDDEDARSASAKKLDPIDKWRARVLYCQPSHRSNSCSGDGEESWTRRIEKQVAVLRVAFPFLTESQIRGKAWQNCGLTSVMGAVPRHGLSPKVKREFVKHRSPYRSTMSQKSRVKNEIKTEKDDKKFMPCPYTFTSPNGQLLTPQGVVDNIDALAQNSMLMNPLSTLHQQNLTQMSGFGVLSASSDGSVQMSKKRKRNPKKVDFDLPKDSMHLDTIPETPEASFRTNSPYCSQTLREVIKPQNSSGFHTIIPSLVAGSNCYTQTYISECSTSVRSDTSKTVSGLVNEINCSKPSQVVNPFAKSPIQDEAYIPPSEYTSVVNQDSQHLSKDQLIPDTVVVSNTKQSFDSHEEIVRSQIDSDPTLSGLNNASNLYEITNASFHSNTTNSLAEKTPTRNTRIGDVKKKIVFEIIAEVYHNDSYVPEEVNEIELNHSNNQDSFEKDVIRVASPVLDGTPNFQMCTFENSNHTRPNFQQSIPQVNSMYMSTAHFAMCTPENMDHTRQDLNEQSAMKHAGDSPINTNPTRATNLSFHLSEKISLINKVVNSDLHENNQNQISYDFYQNSGNFPEEFNANISLPLTQANVEYVKLPASVLLSNYCCEHDKAYTKKDLKPTSHRNYYSDKINEPLKMVFDQVIPPEQSLRAFFEAPDKSFRRIRAEVRETVNDILFILEENDSGERFSS